MLQMMSRRVQLKASEFIRIRAGRNQHDTTRLCRKSRHQVQCSCCTKLILGWKSNWSFEQLIPALACQDLQSPCVQNDWLARPAQCVMRTRHCKGNSVNHSKARTPGICQLIQRVRRHQGHVPEISEHTEQVGPRLTAGTRLAERKRQLRNLASLSPCSRNAIVTL